VVKRFSQKMNPKLMGTGKIEEIHRMKGKRNLNINFDDELTPSQQKNISK
jgi:50S ribosomal subunit-associated GTPase HflX